MNDEHTTDWRDTLAHWLLQHSPIQTEADRRLRAEFVERFPTEKLGLMTLEQYGGGKPDGFCYWLEYQTLELGSIKGGNSAKLGVWWSKSENQWRWNKIYTSAEDAWERLRAGLVALVRAAKQGHLERLDEIGDERLGPSRYSLRGKPLYLYFPDTFLPITNPSHLRHFLTSFQQVPQGDLLSLNRQLLGYLRSLPEYRELDSLQMMRFLYDCLPPPKDNPPPPEPDVVTETLSAELASLTMLAARTHNIILYGPPGTGKTYVVQQFAQRFLKEQVSSLRNSKQQPEERQRGDTDMCGEQPPHPMEHYYTFVTFHQSFAYEEFVEGLKPVLTNGGAGDERSEQSVIQYSVLPGIFRRICERAEADWQRYPENSPKYLLVIDEINRANIAKVFGELITLLEDDKRLGEAHELFVNLPYSGLRFGIPPNLYIIGTMNTADRSIALLDLALRRRFTFLEILPDPSLLTTQIGDINVQGLLARLNRRVTALLDSDHQIGHSYLLTMRSVDDLRFAWYHRIIPLLQEYFYHDAERIGLVLGKDFVQKVSPEPDLFEGSSDSFDLDRPHCAIRRFEGDDTGFLAALRTLSGVPTQTSK